MRALALAVVLLACLGISATAWAQSTGGSFGSSGFGGGGSSGSYGSSSSGSGSSSSESSEPVSAATFSVPSREPGERYFAPGAVTVSAAERAATDTTGGMLGLCSSGAFFVVFGLLFGAGTYVFGRDRYAAPTGPFELRQVTVAFDWTARRALQAQLMELASRAGSDAAGRRMASGAAAELLASACGAARYGVFQTFRLPQAATEAKLHTLAQAYRARFRHELAGERAMGAAPAMRARAEDGEGLVVVTMIVGWRGAMPPLPTRMDAQSAYAAFASLRPGPATDVVALEVIWSPAADDDRMSSAELESLYPELARLDADPRIGRRSCTYCRAVYAAELAQCPGCGAPAA